MPNTAALQPWDEAPMRRDLVQVLLRLPRIRLDLLLRDDTPATPGVYTQWFATRKVMAILGPLVAQGIVASYQGVAATSLRERIGRYRQSINGTAIEERDLYVAVLPCATAASALFAEAALIDELKPPLQGLGWGSKSPGANRKEQSAVDALLPGRRWASPASSLAQARARMQVLSRLINLDPTGPRWPALPMESQRADDVGPLATVTLLAERA